MITRPSRVRGSKDQDVLSLLPPPRTPALHFLCRLSRCTSVFLLGFWLGPIGLVGVLFDLGVTQRPFCTFEHLFKGGRLQLELDVLLIATDADVPASEPLADLQDGPQALTAVFVEREGQKLPE